MADISFVEDRARIWIQDVESELRDVEDVLKAVSTASTTIPGEDDTIMQGIETTCRSLSDFWTTMCNGFKESTRTIKNVIGILGKAAMEAADEIAAVNAKVGS